MSSSRSGELTPGEVISLGSMTSECALRDVEDWLGVVQDIDSIKNIAIPMCHIFIASRTSNFAFVDVTVHHELNVLIYVASLLSNVSIYSVRDPYALMM